MKKLLGLRWRTYRAYFVAAALASLLSAVMLQFAWQSLVARIPEGAMPLVVAACFFLAAVLMNFIFASRESKRIKKRLDDVTAFTAVLARGNLSHRMNVPQKDEVGRVALELNRLAEIMEKHVASLQRLADDNQALAGKVHSAAVIEERQRLARDLHDAVSQKLFALTMLSEAAAATLDAGTTVEHGQLQDIAELAAQVQQEMRALLLHLRPVQLSDESLTQGLKSLTKELEEKSGLIFELNCESLPPLARGMENHLFRILQEALANTLRHADASKVGIHFFHKQGELFLSISDDGKGFNPGQEKKASYGLKTMRERCEEIGGQLTITSREEAGTRIDIRVSLKGKDDAHDHNH